MDVNEIEQLINHFAEKSAPRFLDQPQNIARAVAQEAKLSQLQKEVKDDAHKTAITDVLLIKNHIFTCLHTSETHPLHQKSFQKLQSSNPQYIKDLLGDARLSFEEHKEVFKTMLVAEIGDGDVNQSHFPMLTQAAAMFVMRNRVSELRKQMADNFKDDSFLNEENDRRILPKHEMN